METKDRYIYREFYRYYNNPIIPLTRQTIAAFNDYLNSKDMNQSMVSILHKCAGKYWKNVPPDTANAILEWNWQLADKEYGYVELISTRKLSEDELKIMQEETEAQISDGYNENPFCWSGLNVQFEIFAQTPFEEYNELNDSGIQEILDKIKEQTKEDMER